MAIPGSVNPMMLGGGEAAVYPINQSLRLNSADAYTFRRTVGSASTSQRKFTVSIWSKRGVINSGTTSSFGRQMIVYTGASNGAGNLFGLEWRDDEVACIFNGAGSIYPQTVAKFRDPSAWYHIVVAVDTDQTTAADRCKVYVNGVQQTLTGTLPGSGFDVSNGASTVQTIGELGSLRSNQYVAEAYYINDQQLEPTDFAETNDDGVWIPKAYEGTFTGTNSYYLKFDSAATNGIGHDDSGNGNNFTTTNFTTSGTGTDVMSDTPTTNWCTLSPLPGNPWSTYTVLSEGNLRADGLNTGAGVPAAGTIQANSGKWYAEFTMGTDGNLPDSVGITKNINSTDGLGNDSTSDSFGYLQNGNKREWNTTSSYGSSWGVGDVIGVALDLDNNDVEFYKNGTSQGTAFTGLDADANWTFAVEISGNGDITANFGQRTFEYTPPTGFLPLNTSNLPAPTIKDGSDYFNTVLYTGNGSTQSITGVGFQPDFVWAKSRDTAYGYWLGDVVRGGNERLASDSTQEARTNEGNITFDTDGFSVTSSHPSINDSGDAMVAWNWLAGNGTTTPTQGTIASTASVNATAGFSIVTFTGNGTAGATVGHGLGVVPKMLFWKSRNSGTTSDHWTVYHAEMDATSPEDYAMHLNLTNARNQSATYWNLTAPTSTVFTLGYNAPYLNVSGRTYVAYCFAEVENYSRFGKYTGNGNADGPFVYCGFKPAFVLIKRSSTTGAWKIFDNKRPNAYNVIDARIEADSSGAESTNSVYSIDLVSNGFKLRGTSGEQNGSGDTFVFAAFASSPFGGSGVSPATAR